MVYRKGSGSWKPVLSRVPPGSVRAHLVFLIIVYINYLEDARGNKQNIEICR